MTFDKSFKPTKSDRCNIQFAQVKEYYPVVESCKRVANAIVQSSEAFLLQIINVLEEGRLPAEYGKTLGEDDNNSDDDIDEKVQFKYHAVAKHLGKQKKDLRTHADVAVLHKLDAWIGDYSSLKHRLSELEVIILDLDSKRRSLNKTVAEAEKMKKYLNQTKGKGEMRLEELWRKQHRKEAELKALSAAYTSAESEAYEDLVALQEEAGRVLSLATKLMSMEAKAFWESALQLGTVVVSETPKKAHPSSATTPSTSKDVYSTSKGSPESIGVSTPV